MKLSSVIAAVAAVLLSLGAVAEDKDKKAEQGASSSALPSTTGKTEGQSASGEVSSTGRTAEPKSEGGAAAGSSLTEQKPENPPAPPAKVETKPSEKKY
jgi:hypothetical protein